MRRYIVDLHIAPDELARLYGGRAQSVLARTREGLRVRFPAQHLRGFVTRQGVNGVFELWVDEHNKMLEMRRLSP